MLIWSAIGVLYVTIGALVGFGYYELAASHAGEASWEDVFISTGVGIFWPVLAVVGGVLWIRELTGNV